jgi:hypothetical protein
MYHALQDIKAGEIVCFSGSDAYPLRSQSDFLLASGTMRNSDKDYKAGDQIKIEIPNLINQEKTNLIKLNRLRGKVTGKAKNLVNNMINHKSKALQEIIEAENGSI